MSSPAMTLTAGDRRGVPLPGGGDHRVEDAVDPVADDQLLLVRLEVDVAGPLPDRAEEDGVDEADDRRLVGRLEKVPRLLDGGRRVEVPFPRKPLHDLVLRGVRPLVRGVDPGEHLVLRRADDPGGSGEEPHLVDRLPGLRLPPRQEDDFPGRGPAREEEVPAGVADRDLREQAPSPGGVPPDRTARATRDRSRLLLPSRFGERAFHFVPVGVEGVEHLPLPLLQGLGNDPRLLDDAGSQHDQQVRLGFLLRGVPEEIPQERDVAEEGDLGHVLGVSFPE